MRVAAAYIRVSTDDQLEYSPDSQLIEIRRYAKAHDIVIPEDYIYIEDDGISGRKTKKREAFQRMIGTAKTKPKPFDVILLWKFSRFARNREDSVVYKSMLRKQLGIDVISVSEPLSDDKMSILIEAMIEAMDEYYSINLSEEVTRGMTEKVRRGEPVSIPAFGYVIKEKQYYPNPKTAPIVRSLFEEYAAGAGCRDLATKLNDMGIRSTRGNLFENRTVEYILRNPVYIGLIRWSPSGKISRNFKRDNVMVVQGSHEPIVDRNLWEQVQGRLDEVKRTYPKYARVRDRCDFMLKGLVRCSNCGSTLVHASTGSLQCHSYGRGSCKVSHSITLPKINKIVIESIEATFRLGVFPLTVKPSKQSIDENALIQQQIQREQRKLERIREAYENEVDTLEEYKANKEKILTEIERLNAQLTPAPPVDLRKKFFEKNKNSVQRLKDPTISESEKNEILRSFVDHIVFDRAKGTVDVFYYL